MDRMQELAAIRAAMVVLDAKGEDYSIGDIAHLSDLPLGAVSEYVSYAGCRTELAQLRNRRRLLGYWELDD